MLFALYRIKTFKARPETLGAGEPEKGNKFLLREQQCPWDKNARSKNFRTRNLDVIWFSTVLCSRKRSSCVGIVRGTLHIRGELESSLLIFHCFSWLERYLLMLEVQDLLPWLPHKATLCHFELWTNCIHHHCPCGMSFGTTYKCQHAGRSSRWITHQSSIWRERSMTSQQLVSLFSKCRLDRKILSISLSSRLHLIRSPVWLGKKAEG